MKAIRIIYGTTGGNTQLVCEAVAEQLESLGHGVTLQRAELAEPADLLKDEALILACPTYGHGTLEPNFEGLWNQIQDLDFAGQPAAVIGLGDVKYGNDYSLESARVVEEYLQTHGATLVTRPLRINQCPLPYLESQIPAWVQKFSESL